MGRFVSYALVDFKFTFKEYLMDLANKIGECEERIWATEERISVETDKTERNRWVAELAWLDQELAELLTFCC
jgi:hypothetical protein